MRQYWLFKTEPDAVSIEIMAEVIRVAKHSRV